MKKRLLTSIILSFCVLTGVLAFFQGCETESASENNVVITPQYSSIEEGQSIVLTASGGYSYEWSLSESEWGILTDQTENSIRYTSTYQGSSDNEIQTITVRSYIENASSTTNETAYEHFAYAYITHNGRISISPDYASVALNGSVTFTATGGDPDEYSWSLSEPDWGILSVNGSSATYTRTAGDENSVQILTLSYNGTEVYATITASDSDADLSISPTSDSVEEAGDVVSFSASGNDDDEYEWWLFNDSWGDLYESSDTQVSYVWNGNGDGETQILYCRNSGKTVQAIITQNSSSTTLAVSPTQADVMYLNQVTFTASGGTEDTYSWSLSEPSWGTITKSSDTQAVYVRTAVADGGVQYITVQNGAESVQAVVVHVDTNGYASVPTP